MTLDHVRRRSVGFLEKDDETWACFLVTFMGRDLRWRGYFSFRPKDGEVQGDGVRTADIFLESTESAIDQKARGLGRPLLAGLLSSALHLRDRTQDESGQLRRRFRSLLSENALALAGGWPDGSEGRARDREGDVVLRSLYASYRLDQVAHFIALLGSADFTRAVDSILEGASIDFGTKDRIQFALMVVEHIERCLPLPPFEVWVEDYRAHPDEYALYAHTLHRERRLP